MYDLVASSGLNDWAAGSTFDFGSDLNEAAGADWPTSLPDAAFEGAFEALPDAGWLGSSNNTLLDLSLPEVMPPQAELTGSAATGRPNCRTAVHTSFRAHRFLDPSHRQEKLMSLVGRLDDFAGSVGAAATKAPDDYQFPEFQNYESHKADLRDLWSEIRPQLKRDLDKAEFVDAKLQEMLAAFDAGERERGRKAAWAIYNLQLERLR